MVVYLFLFTNVSAQVRVKRSVGEHEQVKLQEVAPVKTTKEEFIRFSGRLRLGYQMTKDIQGAKSDACNSSLSLAFTTLLGMNGDISVNNQILTNGNSENITFDISIPKEKYSVFFKTTNYERNTVVKDTPHLDKINSMSLSLCLKIIDGLPINITYSNNKNHSKSTTTITQQTTSDNLSFGIQGSAFKDINWNFILTQGNTKDILNKKKTNNIKISNGFNLPITDRLSLNTAISSSWTGNYLAQNINSKITQQVYNTNLYFKATKKLNTGVGVSYSSSKSCIEKEKKTTSSFGNNLNLSYLLSDTTTISYNLNQTNSANIHTENNNINLTYRHPKNKISNVNLSYGLYRLKSDIAKTKRQNLNITSDVKLTQATNLTQSIGISENGDRETLQMNTGVKYNLGKLSSRIDLRQNMIKQADQLIGHTQNIQTNVNYSLSILNRTVPVNLNYGYNLSEVDKVKLTTFGFTFSLPIIVTDRIGLRYIYSQSSSRQTRSQNNTFNTSLRGKKRPYSINTTVSLLKTNTSTKNLTTTINYPLFKTLSSTTSIHWTQKESSPSTYNFNTGIVYSF